MKMWSLKVMILLLFCYACLSTSEGRVFFVSKNFFNILHWDAVEPDFPGQELLYSVRFQRYGEMAFKIEHCQNITALTCNLTAETPALHDVHYVAQVLTSSVSLGYTERFKPLSATTFGPPILSKSTTKSQLFVNVTLPLGPNGESIADIVARTGSKKSSSRTVFVYTLHVTQPEWAAQVIENTTGQFVVDLKKLTEYCGYVVYKPSAEWGRKGSEKASFCVSLSDNSNMLWILVGTAALAAIATVSAALMCSHVKGGKPKHMPQALNQLAASSATRKVLPFPDKNLIISEVAVVTQSEKTTYATIKVKDSVASAQSEGYSPQDVPDVTWRDNTGSSGDTARTNPEPTSGQSSTSYSAVVVHVPDKEDEDFQQAEDRETNHPLLTNRNDAEMSLNLIPRGLPSLFHSDSVKNDPARQLVLETTRDVNGQLVLPSFNLQFQSDIGDTAPLASPERKPLLSDLFHSKDGPSSASLQSLDTSEWSDSGCDESTFDTPIQTYCNSNYMPSQPISNYLQQGPQSMLSSEASDKQGYTPNFKLDMVQESESADGCERRRTNRSWSWMSDNEEEEETESPGQIVLGNWKLQI